jgi:hypothetical protein
MTTESGADRPRCSSSRAAELIQSLLARTLLTTARTAAGAAAAAVPAASGGGGIGVTASDAERDRAVGEEAIHDDNVGLFNSAEPDEGLTNNNNSGRKSTRGKRFN